uniref:Uncharacterized protein n=1 Tax=Arundo donax TaxID=35708 RepID=A0A0A9FIV0_ARUDO
MEGLETQLEGSKDGAVLTKSKGLAALVFNLLLTHCQSS